MLTGDHQTDFAPGGPWDLGVEGFEEEPNVDPEVGEESDPPGTGSEEVRSDSCCVINKLCYVLLTKHYTVSN